MADSNQLSTLQYLDKALSGLKELGLSSTESEPAPIIALLNKISDLDEDKVMAIARTLNEATFFNEVVREQVAGMRVGERYEEITDAFNSIRDDARSLVEQYSDGKLDTIGGLRVDQRIVRSRDQLAVYSPPAQVDWVAKKLQDGACAPEPTWLPRGAFGGMPSLVEPTRDLGGLLASRRALEDLQDDARPVTDCPPAASQGARR